jgi:hypothetical protein
MAPVDPAVGVTDSSRGPVAWMAPEQMEAREYSQKSDVFMFGVCMFEMVGRCLLRLPCLAAHAQALWFTVPRFLLP